MRATLLFYRENFFTLRNGGWTFEAVGEIFFHFRQRHAAALQAAEALDPFDVAVVENAVIVAVAFYVRDEAFFAVKFQGFIRHACLDAGFFHGIHHAYLPTKFITESNR